MALFLQIAFCAQGTLIAQVTAGAEFAEGTVIGAFDATFKARKGGEGFRAGCVFQEDVAEAERVAGVFIRGFHVFGGFAKPVVEDTLLENAHATETPGGADELFDQSLLGGSLGVVLGEEGLQHLFEWGVFFDVKDDMGGGEAVSESVEADGGASFGCAGAGAALGVAAISVDLFLGGHFWGRLRVQRFEGSAGVGSFEGVWA